MDSPSREGGRDPVTSSASAIGAVATPTCHAFFSLLVAQRALPVVQSMAILSIDETPVAGPESVPADARSLSPFKEGKWSLLQKSVRQIVR